MCPNDERYRLADESRSDVRVSGAGVAVTSGDVAASTGWSHEEMVSSVFAAAAAPDCNASKSL